MHLGYGRVETVADRGDYAVRGGIVDLFPPRDAEPLRIDFFGDEVDGIRAFDVATQRTTDRLEACTLLPVSEVLLDDGDASNASASAIARWRAPSAADDPLYAAVSAGQRYQGLEHWLPLFYERLVTVFDYLPDAPVILDQQADEARDRRLAMIAEYYAARREMRRRPLRRGGRRPTIRCRRTLCSSTTTPGQTALARPRGRRAQPVRSAAGGGRGDRRRRPHRRRLRRSAQPARRQRLRCARRAHRRAPAGRAAGADRRRQPRLARPAGAPCCASTRSPASRPVDGWAEAQALTAERCGAGGPAAGARLRHAAIWR